MPAAKSFRLPVQLVDRLETRAQRENVSQTDLVVSLLDEGLKVRAFPGVVYRDGPTGRRAALAAGPDVWEVIGAIRQAEGSGEGKVRNVARMLSMDERWVRLAIEFYSAFPGEVDARIEANEQAAEVLRERVDRREPGGRERDGQEPDQGEGGRQRAARHRSRTLGSTSE
jgi:hypothetical protein